MTYVRIKTGDGTYLEHLVEEAWVQASGVLVVVWEKDHVEQLVPGEWLRIRTFPDGP